MLDLTHIDSALRDRIVAHVVKAFSSTTVDAQPFHHAFVHNVFPEDIYARLLQKLPLVSVLERIARDTRKSPSDPGRWRVQLTDRTLNQLPTDQSRFWLTIRIALCSPEIKEVVCRKLQDGLPSRFRVAARLLVAATELFCERNRDCVAPSSGDPRTLIAMQFSLAHDSDQMHLGTEFYARSWSPLSWRRRPRGFRIVSAAPFLPNTAFMFVVRKGWLRRSWHGRSMRSSISRPRFSLLNHWYVGQQVDDADTVPDNLAAAPLAAETVPDPRFGSGSTLSERRCQPPQRDGQS